MSKKSENLVGDLVYTDGEVLVFDGDSWGSVDQNIQYNYQEVLEDIPIEEIQRFLRKKKLEKIDNNDRVR